MIQAYLNGDTTNGGSDASADWRHYFALNLADLSEPFVILAGPSEGTGHVPNSMVVDNSNRVLAYFKTKFPTLTKPNGMVFGTNYSIDIAAVDQSTGRRIPINNGHLANNWPWETDNLYHMSVAGSYLWLHQSFRGTRTSSLRPLPIVSSRRTSQTKTAGISALRTSCTGRVRARRNRRRTAGWESRCPEPWPSLLMTLAWSPSADRSEQSPCAELPPFSPLQRSSTPCLPLRARRPWTSRRTRGSFRSRAA